MRKRTPAQRKAHKLDMARRRSGYTPWALVVAKYLGVKPRRWGRCWGPVYKRT